MMIFRMTVMHMSTVKVLFSALNVPSGDTALTTACTSYGMTEGWGTNRMTSSLTVTTAFALPSVPFASVYTTSMGISTVACTRAQPARSGRRSIWNAATVPTDVVRAR